MSEQGRYKQRRREAPAETSTNLRLIEVEAALQGFSEKIDKTQQLLQKSLEENQDLRLQLALLSKMLHKWEQFRIRAEWGILSLAAVVIMKVIFNLDISPDF